MSYACVANYRSKGRWVGLASILRGACAVGASSCGGISPSSGDVLAPALARVPGGCRRRHRVVGPQRRRYQRDERASLTCGV